MGGVTLSRAARGSGLKLVARRPIRANDGVSVPQTLAPSRVPAHGPRAGRQAGSDTWTGLQRNLNDLRYEVHARYLANPRSAGRLAKHAPVLAPLQQRVVGDLQQRGIAMAPFHQLFGARAQALWSPFEKLRESSSRVNVSAKTLAATGPISSAPAGRNTWSSASSGRRPRWTAGPLAEHRCPARAPRHREQLPGPVRPEPAMAQPLVHDLSRGPARAPPAKTGTATPRIARLVKAFLYVDAVDERPVRSNTFPRAAGGANTPICGRCPRAVASKTALPEPGGSGGGGACRGPFRRQVSSRHVPVL